MKVSIFGTGYVGLVTGVILADLGHEVLCIDINPEIIEKLNNGKIPIYEPGLEELVNKNYKKGTLKFSTDPIEGVKFGKAIFNAVGTPPDKNNKADLTAVKSVAKTFGENLNEYKVLINKSTVPVGTADLCKQIVNDTLFDKNNKVNFDIISNPEFLREGAAISDSMEPDRIICGVESSDAQKIMEELYRYFIDKNFNILFTDIYSAELIKYSSNSFLATKISFINEIANFAEKVGANINDISKGMGLDPRIGEKFLNAGIGYGGSCFPKDVKALINTGKEYNYNFKIIKTVEEVNDQQKTKLVEKLDKYFDNLEDKNIAIWGIAFKPNTDDIREAPCIEIVNKLIEKGVNSIKVYDPIAMDNLKNIFNDKIQFEDNMYYTAENSDALLIVTDWDIFKNANLEKLSSLMNKKIILDGRNIFNKENIQNHGFIYEGIGV